MIRLACTNCREILTIDDAFAGGVCRCQHCGTIQTVPATAGKSAAANEVAVGGPNLGGGRNGSTVGTAYEGTGLDELAGAVASSGLSSNRLRRPDGTAARADITSAPPARRFNPVPLIATAAVVIVLLAGALVVVATRSRGTSPSTDTRGPTATPNPDAGPSPAPVAAAGPNFCGTPLAGDKVVFILDGGDATKDLLPDLREATFAAIRSLGPNRQFQVVFWANGDGDPVAYPPEKSTVAATAANADAARAALNDAYVSGSTDARRAVAYAMDQHPDTLVLATAKTADYLSGDWVKDLLDARGSAPTHFDTVSLGNADEPNAVLQDLAARTGGTYVPVTPATLAAAGRTR